MQEKIVNLTRLIHGYEGSVEEFQEVFTSRRGSIAQLFKELKNFPEDERKRMGRELNRLKVLAQEKLERLVCQNSEQASSEDMEDITLPPVLATLGSKHPLRIIENKMVSCFREIGFEEVEGSEIEDDWHNFSALNFPEDHPARDMQDTFFLNKDKEWLLRTHTSNVQIRMMSSGKPPFRIVSAGRVFRNEAISVRTHCMFHQVEAFYVDKGVNFAELKGVLLHFVKSIFGKERTLRLRPSYFPFTEPSVEVDMSCSFCAQQGCNVCKSSGWVEVLGAGMIDPNVLNACGIDSDEYSGFALGAGMERIAMLYYQIEDVRLFTQNDVRFLSQFSIFH